MCGGAQVVIAALKDNDVSLRRRALDVLYSMCDSNNSAQIVAELLDYLNGGRARARRGN